MFEGMWETFVFLISLGRFSYTGPFIPFFSSLQRLSANYYKWTKNHWRHEKIFPTRLVEWCWKGKSFPRLRPLQVTNTDGDP